MEAKMQSTLCYAYTQGQESASNLTLHGQAQHTATQHMHLTPALAPRIKTEITKLKEEEYANHRKAEATKWKRTHKRIRDFLIRETKRKPAESTQ
eukprot:2846179-Prymnesium_polylepis.1